MLENSRGEKKIAIVHEWLVVYAGSERVTSFLAKIFPASDIFCSVDFLNPQDKNEHFKNTNITPTFLQRIPFSRKIHKFFLPIYPKAVNKIDTSLHEVIISSSHAFAHHVKTNNNQVHICYCHTPMRYIWDMHDLYISANKLKIPFIKFFVKYLAEHLRRKDLESAKSVNYFIANSKHIKNKIEKFYNRKAIVIYPPVDVEKFEVEDKKKDYYYCSSRFVSYKKIEIIVEAFKKMPDKKLIISGEGKHRKKILKGLTPNIIAKSFLPFDEYHYYLRNARAFVFAAEEDFGITLVEAQACGTPIIAYGKGGATETVIDGKTGVFFDEQSPESLINAVNSFEKLNGAFKPREIRKNAERFDQKRFSAEMKEFVGGCLNGS
jgi:glycosyltransferase involved in cell wall biosynthesis